MVAGSTSPTGGVTDGGAAAGDRPHVRRWRRHRARWTLLVLLALALVTTVWAAVAAVAAGHRLEHVRADVRRLVDAPGNDRTALDLRLQHDARDVDQARGWLHQPGPTVFGWIPILGRNVTSVRSVADASSAALRAGITLDAATRGLGDGRGGVDLAQMRRAAADLQRVSTSLRPAFDELRRQKTGWTLPPVATGVRQARDQLLGLPDALTRGASGLDGLSGVLGGSGRRTVVVALMNNAELRGAGGLPSAYATGTSVDGRLDLSPFQDVNDVAQPPAKARRVPSPPAFHAAYGAYLADTTLWKNVTMSPQGPDVAQVLSQLAATSLHTPADVVLLCDVPAAAAIISATGPVQINGQPVTGDELTKRLLVDAYGKGSLSEDEQKARRRVLDAAASEAFRRLRQQATSTPALLRAVVDAVSGRHIVVWSARPDEQQRLVAAGVAGDVDAAGGDVVMPVANNLGDSPSTGNKLDYYVERQVDVTVQVHPSSAVVTQTLTLHNTAPDTLGPYVAGVVHPGEVRELLSFTTSAGARLTAFTRDGEPAEVTTDDADGGRRVTTLLELARGATTTYRLSYVTPVNDGTYRLLLAPQPLAHAARLRLDVTPVDATLGVVSGADQAVGGRLHVDRPWTSVIRLSVPVHHLHGLHALVHALAHFWSHKVSL